MSLEDDVIDLIAEQLGLDKAEVTPDSVIIDDLGADSLDLTELTMALESHFNCPIPDSESAKLRTVQNVINFIAQRKASSGN